MGVYCPLGCDSKRNRITFLKYIVVCQTKMYKKKHKQDSSFRTISEKNLSKQMKQKKNDDFSHDLHDFSSPNVLLAYRSK